jgi:glycosyltransferase involved in cell wall biosynthesis
VPEVSVVVPISERHDDITKLYSIYADALSKLNKSFEFIFILDGHFQAAREALDRLIAEGKPARVIEFPRKAGEAAALMEGFRQAHGEAILTLASYIQVDPNDLGKVFAAYENGNDLVITRRFPRIDPWFNRIQSFAFHYILRKMTGTSFRDITSGMRLIKREVALDFTLYGDLHRFIPIFAIQKGRKVEEVKVAQRKEDTGIRIVNLGAYLRRILDTLTLFFLIKFTRKPLRFFGLMGTFLFIPGLAVTAFLGAMRLFGGMSLSNRPLLLLGFLLMVFGMQLLSVGLVAELILFIHAKDIKDYNIQEIIE